MRCYWDTAKFAAVMHDDATKRERVTCVACYFCRNNSCVQALLALYNRLLWRPMASFVLKIIKELFRSSTLISFILCGFGPCPGYSCVAILSSVEGRYGFLDLLFSTSSSGLMMSPA